MALLDKEVLTTGEVAKICNVAPRTVSKWFDSGSLKGYRIPGSRDRRIPASELVKFMKAHNIPLEGTASGRTRLLIVDDEKEVLDTLARVLTEQTNYDIRTAPTAFAAGMECERFKPGVILMDIHLGDTSNGGVNADAKAVADMVRRNDNLQYTRIIAMSSKLTDGQATALRSQSNGGFDGFLKKPFQVRQVVEAIEGVLSMAA